MSSARSITAAVNPPRAVYLDYPLGHTAGKVSDPANQMQVMRETLAAFEQIDSPGTIVDLPHEWLADDSWKDRVMRPQPKDDRVSDGHSDDRVERFDTPQYQTSADAEAADSECPTCVFLADVAR